MEDLLIPSEKEKLDFEEKIKEIATLKGITHLDAIIWYCEETGLEIGVASDLTNISLKALLQQDAEILKLLKIIKKKA